MFSWDELSILVRNMVISAHRESTEDARNLLSKTFEVAYALDGLAKCGLPFIKGAREAGIDGMERVQEQGISDRDVLAIIINDGDVLESNDLVRRYRLRCPVPERSPQFVAFRLPLFLVHGVHLCDLDRVLLKDLLHIEVVSVSQSSHRGFTNLEQRNVRPMPSREQH